RKPEVYAVIRLDSPKVLSCHSGVSLLSRGLDCVQ
ncbi:hypothetical protein LCGC14_2937600, partial [marine sediment metagenome]